MSKLTIAQQAAAEIAYRTPAKADRGTRPTDITSEVIALGGAALRELAGDLASAAPTHVEARAKAQEQAKLARANVAATAPKAPTKLEAAVAKGETSTARRMSEREIWAFAAKALREGGHSVPRPITTAAKKGFLAPKA